MVFNLLGGVIIIWLGTITFFVVKLWVHYNTLIGKTKKETLLPMLEHILSAQEKAHTHIHAVEQAVRALEYSSGFHLQKIGLVRFNPFADTGGNQSFTLALLDSENSGIVMTSLYARNGHRWYIKRIQKGVSHEVELAKEEKAAIKDAENKERT